MKKGQKMPEHLRKRRSEYMKLHPLRYWQGKKRKFYILSAKGRAKIIHTLKTRKITDKVIEHGRNLNKGKFGKNHPCWKKNKKRPFYKSIREIFKYRQWRISVFTRDNYVCVLCGKTGYVEADQFPVRFTDILRKHKIKTVDKAITCKKLWDINNGRTLCKKCHLKTITWGRQPGHLKSSLIEVKPRKRATLRKAKAAVND